MRPTLAALTAGAALVTATACGPGGLTTVTAGVIPIGQVRSPGRGW